MNLSGYKRSFSLPLNYSKTLVRSYDFGPARINWTWLKIVPLYAQGLTMAVVKPGNFGAIPETMLLGVDCFLKGIVYFKHSCCIRTLEEFQASF